MKYSLLLFCFVLAVGHAQEPSRFDGEVKNIVQLNDSLWDASKETIVFTGSSSIRMWKNLQAMFPNHQIINTGFGGSQASDLLYHLDNLIFRYQPKKIFIYEGDNDIATKKRAKTIMKDYYGIVGKIKEKSSGSSIVLISPKPSIARWKLKGKYKRLNKKMARFAAKDPTLEFIDVWPVMMSKNKLNQDIFIEDGLHMNFKGYNLWYTAIEKYVN